MREFELRAVMERLEEGLPDEDAVPGRSVETELEVEVVEGTPEDLREGGAAMAIDGRPAGPRRRETGSSAAPRPSTSSRSRSATGRSPATT